MMPGNITFAEVVATDVAEAGQHYFDIDPQLELRFNTSLNVVLDLIAGRPELFAPLVKSVRRARLKTFPYAVYYRIIGSTVQVIGVLHDKRDPAVWQSRA